MQQKIKILFIVVVAMAGSLAAYSQTWLDSANIRINNLRKGDFSIAITDNQGGEYTGEISIKLAKHEFAWGGVIPSQNEAEAEWQRAIIKKYYNYGVAANVYKWPWIEREYGVPTYALQDEMLQWAKNAGLGFRGHALVWGGDETWQMPPWALDDTMTAESIYNATKTHILRDVAYWAGQIEEYDVVNEPVHETWLRQKVGDSVNWDAFKWAREADPDAKLYVNDFNILVWGDAEEYRNYIQMMLNNGAPIDGIGLQSHFEGKVEWEYIKNKLDYMAELGLPLRITEFDTKVDENNVTEAQMAVDYATMMRTAFSHPAVNGFIFWALWDGESWRPGAGLFDEHKMPKQAADSVYNLIHKVWSTNITASANNSNKYDFNGFYGDYTITVDFNGELREFTVPAYQMNEGTEFVLDYANSVPAKASLVEARISKDAKYIELEFDREMDFATFTASEFRVFSDEVMIVDTVEEVDATTARLVFGNAVAFNPIQKYILYFTGDTTKTMAGAGLNQFGPLKTVNNLPAPLTAFTNEAGTEVELTFSQPLSASIENGNFSVTRNGEVLLVSSISLDANVPTKVVLGLSAAVLPDDELRYSFVSNGELSAQGYALGSFDIRYIENMVPALDIIGVSDAKSAEAELKVEGTENISFRPNPVNSELYVENMKNADVIILLNSSSIIMSTIYARGQSSLVIDVANYPTGMYTVQCLGRDGRVLENKKIIKR